jgi:hypothetical protein
MIAGAAEAKRTAQRLALCATTLLPAPALGAELAVVVGVGAVHPPSGAPEVLLRLADDDAWRISSLLGTRIQPDRLRVLTQPDTSTAALPFPGGPPAAPTRSAVLQAAAGLLRAAPPGADRLYVYIAAHGTAEDLYLEDGPTSVSTLRRELQALLDEDDELILIADACYSARWRGEQPPRRDRPRFPLVEASESGAVEVVVDSQTPERVETGGGVLTYLLSSGLTGAADADADQVVELQELSDFVWSYLPRLDAELQPAFRSPGADPHAEVWRQSDGPRLRLEAPTPTRWQILRPDGAPFAEAQTEPGEPRLLALPPGAWSVWEIPVVGTQTYEPGPRAWLRTAALNEGEAQLGPRGAEGVPRRLIPGGRAAAGGPGPQLSVWTTASPPPLRLRLRSAPLHRIELVGRASAIGLGGAPGAWAGGGARYQRRISAGQRGWVEGSGAGGRSGLAELGLLQGALGHEVDLWSRGPVDLAWSTGLGWDHAWLQNEGLEQQTFGPRLLAGPRLAVWADSRGTMVSAGARARPGLLRVQVDAADGLSSAPGWAPDLGAYAVELGIGRRF